MDKVINIENTRFIFETNFSGDPSRDRFRSTQRRANVIINNPDLAQELIDEGFNVRETRPREGEEEGFIPTYFIAIKANYDSKWPPKIYLVSGDSDPVLLDAETVGQIDQISVDNVNVQLNTRYTENGNSLYVRTMYVEQGVGNDPFAERYARRRIVE